MLEQINSARNMGNANATLARTNFARTDQISVEFLVQLIRLSGEDFNGALLDLVFNEDSAVSFINALIEEVEQSKFDDPTPKRLASAFQMVLDHVLEPRTQDSQQAADDTNFDDMYMNDKEDNRAQVGLASNSVENQNESGLLQFADDLIDDEAQEVPQGEESEPETSEEEEEEQPEGNCDAEEHEHPSEEFSPP